MGREGPELPIRPGRGASRRRGAAVADTRDAVDRLFRQESGRAVAILIRVLGDFDLAEEAVQEAFLVALERWPRDGLPANPGVWITTTARNKAIDRLRRERRLEEKRAQIAALDAVGEEPMHSSAIPYDRLRLVFTCCHPALAPESQVALTLRTLGGLSTPEIARAFLLPESTMAQRLVRANGRSATPASRTGCRPITSSRNACALSLPCSTSCSTRATRRRPATR